MRRAAAVLAMALGVTAVACPVPGPADPGTVPRRARGGNGYVDARAWRARPDGYLRFATEQLTPTSPTSVLAT